MSWWANWWWRVLAAGLLALWLVVGTVVMLPVLVLSMGADARGDHELRWKCERVIAWVLG